MSLQGEAQAAGLPCCFVRLAGCPFQCSYCDTRYAREEPGILMSVGDILERLHGYPCRLVEVTGGEPLMQPNTAKLLRALHSDGWEVLLETSGRFPLDGIPSSTAVVMDIKTPGSGNPGFLAANLKRLGPRDAVKFVICGKDDFEWACACVREFALTKRTTVFFTPAWDVVPMVDLAEWMLAAALPDVRFQLPLHKVLWNGDRGR